MNFEFAGNIMQCTKCNDWLSEDFFNMRKERGTYYRQCRGCMASRKWAAKNPERHKEQNRKWVENNKDRARELWRNCRRRRLEETPAIRVHGRISNQIWQVFKRNKSGKKSFELLGYTRDELVAHLEKQFTKGMSWENIGEWHIDHIIPLSSFNLYDINDEELKKAWSLPNLRPLWAKQNLTKRNKMEFLL